MAGQQATATEILKELEMEIHAWEGTSLPMRPTVLTTSESEKSAKVKILQLMACLPNLTVRELLGAVLQGGQAKADDFIKDMEDEFLK